MWRQSEQTSASLLVELNVTPFIDVLLVLLVVFLVTMPVMYEQITLQLPSVKHQPAPAIAPIRVGINAQGQWLWNEQPISRMALIARAQAVAAQAPSVAIFIAATVPYMQVAQLLADLQQAGIQNLALMTAPS